MHPCFCVLHMASIRPVLLPPSLSPVLQKRRAYLGLSESEMLNWPHMSRAPLAEVKLHVALWCFQLFLMPPSSLCLVLCRLRHRPSVSSLRRRHGHIEGFHLLRLYGCEAAVWQHAVSLRDLSASVLQSLSVQGPVLCPVYSVHQPVCLTSGFHFFSTAHLVPIRWTLSSTPWLLSCQCILNEISHQSVPVKAAVLRVLPLFICSAHWANTMLFRTDLHHKRSKRY